MSEAAELTQSVKDLSGLMVEQNTAIASLAVQVKVMWGIMCALGIGCIGVGVFIAKEMLSVLFNQH